MGTSPSALAPTWPSPLPQFAPPLSSSSSSPTSPSYLPSPQLCPFLPPLALPRGPAPTSSDRPRSRLPTCPRLQPCPFLPLLTFPLARRPNLPCSPSSQPSPLARFRALAPSFPCSPSSPTLPSDFPICHPPSPTSPPSFPSLTTILHPRSRLGCHRPPPYHHLLLLLLAIAPPLWPSSSYTASLDTYHSSNSASLAPAHPFLPPLP